jgi:hypothetical protein
VVSSSASNKPMSKWRSRIVWGCISIAVLIVGLLSYGLLSPSGREMLEHYQCLERESLKADAVGKLIGSSLKEGQATRNDVRQFLKQNFVGLPIHEAEAEVSAGHMIFYFDRGGVLTKVLQEIPCPIA